MLMISGAEKRTGALPLSPALRTALRNRLNKSTLAKLSRQWDMAPETILRGLGGCGIRAGSRLQLERALAAPEPSDSRSEDPVLGPSRRDR